MATKFDIKEVSDGMLSALREHTGKGWSKFKSVVREFDELNADRLGMLAAEHLSGNINKEEFEQRLEDEKLMLEAQLNALNVIAKAAVQNAVNAAFDVLRDAVYSALP
ncbi:hypothetical protein [Arcticibacter sp. MXS-1]|uniref:hypothetical protein n=1 Tax=Arcticibacter sp. MXS-1 TaxID=3341726 RepID=UPI0035A8BDF7